MDRDVITILVFSLLFIVFTVVVGHLLRSRGKVFLEHVFVGDSRAVTATNFLLNIGFYLLCLGMLLWNIGLDIRFTSDFDAVRTVAVRLGVCITVVAVLHSVNVLVLALLLRRGRTGADRAS